MVTHITYKNKNDEWLEPKNVQKINGVIQDENNKEVITGKVEKMSKSKKNVVDPNDIIESYGADTARWFMLSDSPPDRDLQWTDTGVIASSKFINKLYEFVDKYENYSFNEISGKETIEILKGLINKVTQNIEAFQFNKSVANIYEYVNVLNEAIGKNRLSKEEFNWALKRLAVILQPFVPHISEELWSKFNEGSLCIRQTWPIENTQKKKIAKIAIQINGKTREIIEVNDDISKNELLEIVKKNSKINKNLINRKILREIYVPEKIINLVVE